jgi:spore germination protein GerM
MSRQAVAAGLVGATAIALGSLLFAGLPRWYGARAKPTGPAVARTAAPSAAPTTVASGRKIKAHLFYVAEDGLHLTSVERDVAYGDGPLEQAREILNAQVAPVAEPTVSAVPAGTTLRALFLTDRGVAFVDLSRDVAAAHTGGTDSELLTVYTIVNALTMNLPAITTVQVLVDGKEVETLAGHVDLRRPLARNLGVVQ